MYTDFFVTRRSLTESVAKAMAFVKPALAERILARRCPELAGARVIDHPALVLRQRRGRKRFAIGAGHFMWCSALVHDWVRYRGFHDADALMGFTRHLDPRLIELAKSRGLRVIADQFIAPASIEASLLREQARRYPGWETDDPLREIEPYVEWERRSWAALDHVTCASAFVRDGLLAQGVPADRVSVIEYPIDCAAYTPAAKPAVRGEASPLTVLCVGTVCLRKGAPAFAAVAKKLASASVRFAMIGRVALAPPGVAALREAGVELVGEVPRGRVAARLAEADVFLLPSVCEGSASAALEAMAAGLPVVTTPHAGTVARDGVEGFIVPPDDTEAMAERVERLIRDAELRTTLGAAARKRAEVFTLDRYADAMERLVRRVVG